MIELAAVFNNAIGDRLRFAERFVRSLAELFPSKLAGAILGYRSTRSTFLVVVHFDDKAFGPELEARFGFWVAGAGGQPINLTTLHPDDRRRYQERVDACDAKEEAQGEKAIADAMDRLLTRAVAPPNRREAPRVRAEIAVDLGQSTSLTYDVSESGIFLPSAWLPPIGDQFHLLLHVPGVEAPFDLEVKVTQVRGGSPLRGGKPAGYGLQFLNASEATKVALRQFFAARKEGAGKSRRASPRYPVQAAASVHAAPAPPQLVDLRFDAAGLKDSLENLSRGGAFVRTAQPYRLQSQVIINLAFPDGARLSTPGTVVHVNPQGMGLQFELDDVKQRALDRILLKLAAPPKRALVVDDDALMRKILSDCLSEHGFEVLTAEDGVSGLHVLLEEILTLDVLISDVHMPNMDGAALLDFVRRRGGELDLAIFMLSGLPVAPELQEKLTAMKVDAVLEKRLGPPEIARRVAEAVDRRRAER